MADLPSADLLLDLARQYDEPIIDSSMIPTFSKPTYSKAL